MPILGAMASIRVIWAGPRCVVVEKPLGMLSVPGKGPGKQDCVAARVREAFPHATGPLIVHRLDMETSGLMVLALDADAHRDLSRQFEQREVEKQYVAVLEGSVCGDEGVVDLPLRHDIENRPHQIVDFVHGGTAITQWRVTGREADRTRVLFLPKTGKSHQLRMHAATPPDSMTRPDGTRTGGLGCPIVGDTLYGKAGTRMLLHASLLAFRDPASGERVEFASEPEF